MTYPYQHDGTGADVECRYDPQETIRSLLHEASDALLRLELFMRNKSLTDEQTVKLERIIERADGILGKQERNAA